MGRVLSVSNVLSKKHKVFRFGKPWSMAMGEEPSRGGCWLIYGAEKNGKTWFALLLAKYLAKNDKVLYVSAEEGTEKEFTEAIVRAGINENDTKLKFTEYLELEELTSKLKKRDAPTVVVTDNLTIYSDVLKKSILQKMLGEFPDTLFIFLAHEERGEPHTAIAKYVRRMSKIIFHVRGLRAFVSGRCIGGELIIDEEKSNLYYGTQIKEKDENN